MPIREDIGFHHHLLPHRSFDGKAAGVNLGFHTLDDHPPSAFLAPQRCVRPWPLPAYLAPHPLFKNRIPSGGKVRDRE
jgi:hypothetical protein